MKKQQVFFLSRYKNLSCNKVKKKTPIKIKKLKNYKKKDPIPIKIKKDVWNRDKHPADERVAQCCSCEILVMAPMSIQKSLKLKYDILPWECQGVGEFGHIISEFNGGKNTVDNLRIQCKNCNVKLGKKNMMTDNLCSIMLDTELCSDRNSFEDTQLNMTTEKCCHILKNNKRCKNHSFPNRNYCSIHLNC